jgi:FdrA protein
MSEIKTKVIHHSYHDSVVLMQIAQAVQQQSGVEQATVMMGTDANKAVMRESGLWDSTITSVSPDDLVIVIKATNNEAAQKALLFGLEVLEGSLTSLQKVENQSVGAGDPDLHAIDQIDFYSDVTDTPKFAVISVPGEYAAAEAWKAIKSNCHVLIFSDHVSIEDELALKIAGRDRGLLVMGPECGTAMVGGVPLAFANQVCEGGIGLVAAAGSGLQEAICLISRMGGGISHAIGTGGRDLSEEIGGLTMETGIDLLMADEKTKVLAILSKPPDPLIANQIIEKIRNSKKPVVVCFLGRRTQDDMFNGNQFVETIEELAIETVELSGKKINHKEFDVLNINPPDWKMKNPLLRGLFTGGTLAYEAMVILQNKFSLPIFSNTPLHSDYYSGKDLSINDHICLDLGASEYTLSAPHPMIDGRLRSELLTEVAADPRVGIVLFDLILGFGSENNPAGVIAPAIVEALQNAQQNQHPLLFIASITGTDQDLQNRKSQKKILINAGVHLAPSNAAAVKLAGRLITAR